MASKTLQCHSGELLFLLGPATKWELSLKFISVCFSFSFSFSFENTDSFACCVPIMWAATPPPPPSKDLHVHISTDEYSHILKAADLSSCTCFSSPGDGKGKPTAFIASTIRNEQTYQCFLDKLGKKWHEYHLFSSEGNVYGSTTNGTHWKWTHRTFAIMGHVT